MITSDRGLSTNNDNDMTGAENKLTHEDGDSAYPTRNDGGERSRSQITGHVLIDKDTDISYYDHNNDNTADITGSSSSSYLAANSAYHSHRFTNLAYPLIGLFFKIFI